MRTKALRVAGGRLPKSWVYPGSQRGRITLRRFEQGRFAASHICFRGVRTISG